MDTMFVYNPSTHRLHRLPASESCNTDQILGRKQFKVRAEVEAKYKVVYCKRCFPYSQ